MNKIKKNQIVIPLLPLRDIVVFPGMITPLFVGTSQSITALEEALSKDKKNVGKELRLILCKDYGKVFKTAQNLDDEFKGWLKDYFKTELY